jgi:hypothetical protein
MKSIIQNDKECFICGNPYCEEHHIIFGSANRKLSEKYGLKVYLCYEHHRGSNGIHGINGKPLDTKLKQYAQKKFNEAYPELNFMQIFGKNYL